MSLSIEVLDDPASVCAQMLSGAAAAGAGGGAQIVLAGGSTPRAVYEQLAGTVRAGGLDLGLTTFWFGDERCVSPEDERSNYKMVKAALLDQLGDAARLGVRRISGELGPFDAADAYEHELRAAGPPRFDLVLLGIGPDGHTASLFPDQPSLGEDARLVLGVPQAGLEPYVPRVTLTLPALALARNVVMLASGSSKARAVLAAFGPDARPDPHVPCSLLPPLVDELTVLLDPAAAARL